MASSAHRLSAELLLPVSFAMSRSILTSLDGAAWSFNLALLLGATLLCRLVDGVLRNLMDIEAGGAYGLAATSPDALVYGLSMLLQLGGSAGVWSMAELLAGVAGSKLTAAAAVGFAPSTLVGLLGIGGTVLAFVLPRVLRAHPNGWLQRIVGFRWLRHQLGQPHSPLTPVHPPRSPMSDFSGAASARSECSPPYSAGSVSSADGIWGAAGRFGGGSALAFSPSAADAHGGPVGGGTGTLARGGGGGGGGSAV